MPHVGKGLFQSLQQLAKAGAVPQALSNSLLRLEAGRNDVKGSHSSTSSAGGRVEAVNS
jgi:hypothetical protein